MYDLSILIPARNEQFIGQTVQNILDNKRGKTEILVGLDGEPAEVPEHPDVRILSVPESIGQRAMQNRLAEMSTAKYVAKTDAHCAFSEGFDVELLKTFEELGDDIVVAPMMLNLWAYDWKCMKCGSRWYQGPTPTQCMKRGGNTSEVLPHSECDNATDFTQKIVFKPRPDTPHSTSYRFDNMLHFQYFDGYKSKQQGDLVESMSLQGSFFACTRLAYFDLPLCDETWGSWGQQGSEVSIKARLSGMRVIINKRCWYGHLFRTQAGFSFPYPQSGKSQQNARDICNDVFKNSKWDKQIYPLSSIVEKFWPIPGWSDEDLKALKENELKTTRPGIYSIKSKSNGKIYVGSALNLAQRFGEHLRRLKRDDHENNHLQRGWNRYGADDFTFSIEYFCDAGSLLKEEQRFIDTYKEELGWRNMYNMNPEATSGLGRKHTQESLAKMSLQQSGENNGFFGKKHSPESRQKMKDSHTGQEPWNRGVAHSKETRNKISEALQGRESWNKGLNKENNESIRKISEQYKGRHLYGEVHPRGMLGKQHSEETKKQIRESAQEIAKNRVRDTSGQFIKPPSREIIYYSAHQKPLKVSKAVQNKLREISKQKDIPIRSVTLKPMDKMGTNICLQLEPGKLTYFQQIITALRTSTADIVYMAEDDVLYHESHFDYIPEDDKFHFDTNWWKIRVSDGFAAHWDAAQVSGLVARREPLLAWYRDKLDNIMKKGFDRRYEPGGRHDEQRVMWKATAPHIDIRVGGAMTASKWSLDDFRDKSTAVNFETSTIENIDGWGYDELRKLIEN